MRSQLPPDPPPDDPLRQASPKSYGVAVALSAVFGFFGIQHFYLGRPAEGLIDVGLSFGWLYSFAVGEPLYGVLLLAADAVHAFVVTILLLTGNFRDGQGRIVCYPGQRLGPVPSNPTMRSSS